MNKEAPHGTIVGPAKVELSSDQLERIRARLRQAGSGQSGVIRRAPRDQAIPQSFAQQRIWYLEQAIRGTSMYNMPECARLRGDLDHAVLREAVLAVIERHEAWRTRFATLDGLPVQKIGQTPRACFTRAALDGRVIDDLDTVARKHIEAQADIPFDLDGDEPLVRVHVLTVGPHDHFLLLNVHHIISDGWSTSVFLAELAELYRAFKLGRPPKLPLLEIQYADYAAWQHEHWTEARIAKLHDYWREALAQFRPVALPLDFPRPAQHSDEGDFQLLELTLETTRRLKALATARNTTLFVVLASGFKTLIHRLTGETDVSPGVPVAGRSRIEFEPLLGLFANTVLMRSDLSQDPAFADLLEAEKRASHDAYAFQDMPFERIVAQLQPDRDPRRNPLFQIMFILQNLKNPRLDLPDLSVELIATGTRSVKFDIVFELYETGDGLRGWLGYQRRLFRSGTITRLLAGYKNLLEEAVRDPQQRISRMTLISPRELRTAASDFNEPL